MLELYHHGSSVCAAKARLAIGEKGVKIDRYHYVDILQGEQFTPAYRKINPNAVVPSLIHDGKIINESTLICDYIDEAFEGPALQVRRPYDRYRMRTWTKAVDELLQPACADVTYVACHRHIIKRLPANELEAYFQSTPETSVKGAWRQRKRELVMLGFEAPDIDAKFRLYDDYLHKMEAALEHGPWLIGKDFTLADISMAPYVNRLAMLNMFGLWQNGRLPRVAEWFERIQARPSFKPALLDWVPPELTADLARFGSQSWPEVQRILQ